MNIQAFSMVGAAYLNPTAYGDLHGANYLVWPKGRLSANAALLRDWLIKERDLAE